MSSEPADAATPAFLAHLAALPAGYIEGRFAGERWGATLRRSSDGRRVSLYAEELGGAGRVSCNLYRTGDGRARLKPCEMPASRVLAFVAGFRPNGATELANDAHPVGAGVSPPSRPAGSAGGRR